MTESKASKRSRWRYGKYKNKVKTKPLTSFSPFKRLPQELQNLVWNFALVEEVKHTIVLFDKDTGGLVPSVQLISSISMVSAAPRTLATKFYNVELQVFACIRQPPAMKAERRRSKGVIRLNLDATMLLLNFSPVWFLDGIIEEILSGDMDDDELGRITCGLHRSTYLEWSGNHDNGPLGVTRSHITAPLTESQRAQVKRVCDHESYAELLWPCFKPDCCSNCEWRTWRLDQHLPHKGPVSTDTAKAFPNIWLSRVFITTGGFNLINVARDYALSTQKRLWEIIWPWLVTCRDFPIRRAVKHGNPYGHFEVDDDEEIDDKKKKGRKDKTGKK